MPARSLHKLLLLCAAFFGILFSLPPARSQDAARNMDEKLDWTQKLGFAVLAYPAIYGVSGVKTFLVSHDGIVYEKDLGDDTRNAARAMAVFDPDPSWAKATP